MPNFDTVRVRPTLLSESEATVIAHFRGDCHDGNACDVCRVVRGTYTLGVRDGRAAAIREIAGD